MAQRNRQPLACAHCGAEFPRVACAGLFCGDDCAVRYEAHLENASIDLKAAGFAQHSEVPNLWVKDSHAISIEQVTKIGMGKAIEIHASHVAGAQLAQG